MSVQVYYSIHFPFLYCGSNFKSTEIAVDEVNLATQPPPASTSMEPGFAPTEIQNEITFTKTFGDNCRDRGINLLQARDGGYPIVGYTSSLDIKQEDIYLVRTDIQGNILWSKTYGGEGKDNGWDVLELEDGGFLIAGSAHLPAVCFS